MTSTCKKITIFEGPDGSGKTSRAMQYATETGAAYYHFGPFPHFTGGVERLYVEGMLPALLGYQDVVMDRCWLSEAPYGKAFRKGADRIGVSQRMLERVALRAATTLVRCCPPWESVRENYLRRKGQEYLTSLDQLRLVYDEYLAQPSALPTVWYDYHGIWDDRIVEQVRSTSHRLDLKTAGVWAGKILLVGESFGEVKAFDPLYQWPFSSFSATGCSRWLAEQLELADVGEQHLWWVNAGDQKLATLADELRAQPHLVVIALGTVARDRLTDLGVHVHAAVPHPQAWKRFHASEPYPLVEILKEAMTHVADVH